MANVIKEAGVNHTYTSTLLTHLVMVSSVSFAIIKSTNANRLLSTAG